MGCLWGSAWRPFEPPEFRYKEGNVESRVEHLADLFQMSGKPRRIANSANRQKKERNLYKLTRSFASEILMFEASSSNVSFSNDWSREVTAMKYVLLLASPSEAAAYSL